VAYLWQASKTLLGDSLHHSLSCFRYLSCDSRCRGFESHQPPQLNRPPTGAYSIGIAGLEPTTMGPRRQPSGLSGAGPADGAAGRGGFESSIRWVGTSGRPHSHDNGTAETARWAVGSGTGGRHSRTRWVRVPDPVSRREWQAPFPRQWDRGGPPREGRERDRRTAQPDAVGSSPRSVESARVAGLIPTTMGPRRQPSGLSGAGPADGAAGRGGFCDGSNHSKPDPLDCYLRAHSSGG
jgi:hypothetical protein